MSFYSYKNANSDACPGVVNGSILNGLNQRVCIQVKNVYDSSLSQEQLDDEVVTIENIVPVLPNNTCRSTSSKSCSCNCSGNTCTCNCPTCGTNISHAEAVENAENSACPLPQPYGAWTFESCRSSTTAGRISNLSIERMCDRPQFARVRCSVDVPVDVLFVDQRCQEWMGQTRICVDKDVLLCIPDDSIIPFTLESLVSAICVSGTYIGNCTFEITICVTVVLKVLAEVDILIPTYGFCEVPPSEEFAENVCDEFFSLPLFPQSSCNFETVGNGATSTTSNGNGTAVASATLANGNGCVTCGSVNTTGGACAASTCSNCGTTCLSGSGSLCPRCGCTMTSTT
ncbi:MAG: hypothetical protein IJ466_03400 [Clostridia bacterium]|nr:hypothetical protein [Clostridia bacterium]